MKSYKSLLLLVTIALVNSNIMATLPASIDLVNKTGETIIVRIKGQQQKGYSMESFSLYQIILPGQTLAQTFSPKSSRDKIDFIYPFPCDKTMPKNGGLDLVDKTTGKIPDDKQRLFDEWVAPSYILNSQVNRISNPSMPLLDPVVKKYIISDSGKKDNSTGYPIFNIEVE